MEESLNQSVDTSAPVSNEPAATSQEKMLRQSEVNELIGRVKREEAAKAVENYKRTQQQEAPQTHREPSMHMDESRYRQLAAEEAQRLRDQWFEEARTRQETENAQRIVKSFYDKIEAGKQKYEDFEKMTGDIDLQRFPNVVQLLAENIDNSHDVLYELGRDRLKMAQLETLAERSPRDAIVQAQRLAQSIKDNESVGNQRQANAPLSQQRPSNIGTDSGSVLSMRDLKAKYKA